MKASDLAAALLPAPLTAAQQSQGQQLHALHRAKQGTHKWNEMQAARDKLPAAAKRRAVLSALEGHSVLVVSGETGCGKTTQVPQFILDDAIESGRAGAVSIICTQPRRLSAIGVATRVAAERCEPLGQTVLRLRRIALDCVRLRLIASHSARRY